MLARDLMRTMELDHECKLPVPFTNKWDQANLAVITYGDSIVRPGERPLRTLRKFLVQRLEGIVSTVHILPFFPYSSDDGFSVIDYLEVDQRLGDWQDIGAISETFRPMVDLVINHCSAESAWFSNYLNDQEPGKGYFIEVEPDADVSSVVRPRSTPLLKPVQTVNGVRHVWCTFSHDQVDLNFSNPEVLRTFVSIIRHYLKHGVKVFRLDAIAFLWKRPGSNCINLRETHTLVRLLRALIEYREPDAVIITETNVPNHENLAYFGNANEAHVIYNFSLAPLLLNTMISGNCTHLKAWMMRMPPSRNGTAYLNFLASHDGIGLRPVEGLLEDDEREQLIHAMRGFGGRVSWRLTENGEEVPYEINISMFDAMQGTITGGRDEWQVQRFLCAHAIILALEGIPAIYIHSFLATGNDVQAVERTGQLRSINRHKWDADQLDARLDDDSPHARVYRGLCALIRIRREQKALHPNATQFTLQLGPQVFGIWRQSQDRLQNIFALHNISSVEQVVSLADLNLVINQEWVNLVENQVLADTKMELILRPYQVVWICNRLEPDLDDL
jgi:sucrose phosphorylase